MRFRTVALGLSGLGLGCQLIAGDFEIVPDPPAGDACLPDQARCVGARLETCNAQRSFVLAEDCGSPDTCDPTAQACHPCGVYEYACNGEKLVICSAEGQWAEALPACATPQLCYVSADRLSGGCTQPECEVDQFQCEQSRLLRCAPGRDRYEVVEHCASAEGCDVALAESLAPSSKVHCAPSCAPGECGTACTPGTTRCVVDPLPGVEHCSAEGRWVMREVCTNRVLCDAAAGRCWPPACQPAETRCRGQAFERCSNDLTHFRVDTPCADNQRCDPERGCVVAACSEGDLRCNGKALERCEAGHWEPRQVCATRELCSPTGGCTLPTCLSQSYDCDEQRVLQCSKGRDEWEETLICYENEVCTKYPDAEAERRGCDPI